MPAEWIIERLAGRHQRKAFSCGEATLDDWLRMRASQFDKRDLARTFVATRHDSPVVLGYYALANHRVIFELLPQELAKGLPRIDIPVVLLGRLAVDQTVQGQRLGEFLLIDALRRTQYIADQIGIRAIEVEAINPRAQAFYKRYGFASLTDDPNHLFLPMQVIRKLRLPPWE